MTKYANAIYVQRAKTKTFQHAKYPNRSMSFIEGIKYQAGKVYLLFRTRRDVNYHCEWCIVEADHWEVLATRVFKTFLAASEFKPFELDPDFAEFYGAKVYFSKDLFIKPAFTLHRYNPRNKPADHVLTFEARTTEFNYRPGPNREVSPEFHMADIFIYS